MFKLAQSPKFWATVKAEVQAEDGRRVEVRFDVQYHRLALSRIKEITDEISANRSFDDELLREIVADWRGIADEDGEPLAFNAERLQQLFDAGFGPAVLAAFWAALPKARAKN